MGLQSGQALDGWIREQNLKAALNSPLKKGSDPIVFGTQYALSFSRQNCVSRCRLTLSRRRESGRSGCFESQPTVAAGPRTSFAAAATEVLASGSTLNELGIFRAEHYWA